MGKWGQKLYENDIAEDLKIEFSELLRRGLSSEQITNKMMTDYNATIKRNDDEAVVFWLVLADLQWSHGCLTDYVREKANHLLQHLSVEADEIMGDSEAKNEQRNEYQKLTLKLNSGVQNQLKIDRPKLFRCTWKIGDVFAHRIVGEFAHQNGLFGRHLLLIKTGECKWHPGHIIPICTAKISKDIDLPDDLEIVKDMESIIISYSRFSNSHLNNSSNSKIVTNQGEEQFYLPDGSVFYPHYHFQLVTKSNISIPKKLMFIGNIAPMIRIYDEEVDQKTINMTAFNWNEIDNKVLERYVWFNQKEASIFR